MITWTHRNEKHDYWKMTQNIEHINIKQNENWKTKHWSMNKKTLTHKNGEQYNMKRDTKHLNIKKY